MTKFTIAAVAAALLASTSVSFAEGDSGREIYQSALSFNLSQQPAQQINVRNAHAQAPAIKARGAHVAKPVSGNAGGLDRQDVQTAN